MVRGARMGTGRCVLHAPNSAYKVIARTGLNHLFSGIRVQGLGLPVQGLGLMHEI